MLLFLFYIISVCSIVEAWDYCRYRLLRRTLCARGTVYYPRLVRLCLGGIRRLNDWYMQQQCFISYGAGLYGTREPCSSSGPMYLYIGGIGSSCTSSWYMRNVHAYIQRKYGAGRLIVYNPPETSIGRYGYSHLHVRRGHRKYATRLLSHLTTHRLLTRQSNIASIRMIGSDYGSILCTHLRTMYPSKEVTELWDPLVYTDCGVRNFRRRMQRIINGQIPYITHAWQHSLSHWIRHYLLTLVLGDIHIINTIFMDISYAETNGVFYIEHMGQLSVFIGEYNEINRPVSYDTMTPNTTICARLYIGDILVNTHHNVTRWRR